MYKCLKDTGTIFNYFFYNTIAKSITKIFHYELDYVYASGVNGKIQPLLHTPKVSFLMYSFLGYGLSQENE